MTLKILGALFFIAASTMVGIRASGAIHENLSAVRELLALLSKMRAEIVFRQTPLPELMEYLSTQAQRPDFASFFHTLSDNLIHNRRKPPCDIVKLQLQHAQGLSLPQDAQQELQKLLGALGTFHLTAQCEEIDRSLSALKKIEESLEADEKGKTGTYRALGICTGIAIAVLLL